MEALNLIKNQTVRKKTHKESFWDPTAENQRESRWVP
jgi:hypothetical protein